MSEVTEGSVLTSAGVAAGIDLCLHIIRTDAGALAANQRARGRSSRHRTACYPDVTRAADVAAVPASGSQQRPVLLVPDPSGRLGLYSSHLLVKDGQQGIDGRHEGDFTGYELG